MKLNIYRGISWFTITSEVNDCKVSEDFNNNSSDGKKLFIEIADLLQEVGGIVHDDIKEPADLIRKLMEFYMVSVSELSENEE